MTDKERLEYLKEDYEKGIGFKTISRDDFDWIIKQVERKQELERSSSLVKSMTQLLNDFNDEFEVVSAAYQDAQKEISILKRRLENEKVY